MTVVWAALTLAWISILVGLLAGPFCGMSDRKGPGL